MTLSGRLLFAFTSRPEKSPTLGSHKGREKTCATFWRHNFQRLERTPFEGGTENTERLPLVRPVGKGVGSGPRPNRKRGGCLGYAFTMISLRGANGIRLICL